MTTAVLKQKTQKAYPPRVALAMAALWGLFAFLVVWAVQLYHLAVTTRNKAGFHHTSSERGKELALCLSAGFLFIVLVLLLGAYFFGIISMSGWLFAFLEISVFLLYGKTIWNLLFLHD